MQRRLIGWQQRQGEQERAANATAAFISEQQEFEDRQTKGMFLVLAIIAVFALVLS